LLPQSPSCGDKLGSINLTVSGGIAPYQFAWAHGAITEDLSNLSAGDYSVVVTDANGCQTLGLASIVIPETLSVTSNSGGTICSNSLGSVGIAVSGGSSPYSYQWSNGATSKDLVDYFLLVQELMTVPLLLLQVGEQGYIPTFGVMV